MFLHDRLFKQRPLVPSVSGGIGRITWRINGQPDPDASDFGSTMLNDKAEITHTLDLAFVDNTVDTIRRFGRTGIGLFKIDLIRWSRIRCTT